MWLVGERPWAVEPAGTPDLEDRIADWMARQQSTSWVVALLVLGTLLALMVLFALSR